VETCRNADALQWLTLCEILADLAQYRHVHLCPVDAIAARIGELEVLHVIILHRDLRVKSAAVAMIRRAGSAEN
jgi:hypothetical protein